MKRHAMKLLEEWKSGYNRKPLIVRGARQVGKTWLIREFAKTAYENHVYVNFETDVLLKSLFTADFDVRRILTSLELYAGIKIEPDKTLLIFDEIQEAEKALTSLKYFQENAPQYHIIAAGSLLGIALQKNTSFPVGKVAFLDLYPLSFTEFLQAAGENGLTEVIQNGQWDIMSVFKNKYIERLKQYYYIGGMPEVVAGFVRNNDFREVRLIQQQILDAYEQDFSKHAPVSIVPRIRMLWNSIPAQLAKENRKFIYGLIRQGARAKEFELALAWLTDCGLIHKVNRVTKPGFPLKAYEDFSAFKLFSVDVGLLACMSRLDVRSLLEGNSLFEEFKGALTEQYVLQQLITEKACSVYYWSAEKSDGEIDFLLQSEHRIIPLEVKAAENLHAKSLRFFCEKYKPEIAVRTSLSDFRKEEWLVNLPLYAVNGLNSPTLSLFSLS
ncbi:MAG: ATP-binding protein [Tannerellaceae bacterium]|nr:ATP-binding protein [Tannerellaceae bacterium]